MPRSPLTRRGMTLVELLIVIAIIGLLVLLTLPAINATREAARRMQCQSNLKQLGIAVNAHESARRRFPPGALNEWSWIGQILPQLEEQALYERFDLTLDPFIPPNDLYSGQTIAVLLCPSDARSAEVFVAYTEISEQAFAHTNYLGTLAAGSSDGMFARTQGVRMREVRDGASHTLLVGERPVIEEGGHTHGWWVWGITGDTYLSTNSSLREGLSTEHSAAYHFWSDHPAGANFVFVDGSVRLLTYDLAPEVFQAVCTKAGSESAALDE